ncbi:MULTISPECIES: cupin domain-containing protein [unclassified Pseudomonas]|jgi:quercetin dioxygenase-like cupin family protein|uniref:cupin domain-containing protein n=1 Tax=unclassified Pseudomonas TaxID=196821 RepID=UPI00069EA449|nr:MULTISPECIES: cupin domain-containing protein [unclassified Pseudomonas]WPN45257.1 cupin domain-containing protein [Pseudomonas sp. P8_241]
MRRNLLLVSAAVLASVVGYVQAQELRPAAATPAKSWQQGLHRTDLIRQDLDVSNPEVIQVRVDFDSGVVSPKHAHPGVEVAYVISGTFEYQLEGRAPVTLKAGDSLFIPAGVAHVAKNVGSDKASELATYMVQKGEPLLILKE